MGKGKIVLRLDRMMVERKMSLNELAERVGISVVYFLGDAGDRGPHPWECIKTILDDPQFIYIKGNHEDMLVDAMGRGYGRQYNLLRSNGGKDTYHQAMEEPNWAEWRARLRDLPDKALYTNTQLSPPGTEGRAPIQTG